MYKKSDTKEGQNDLFQQVRQRDQTEKDKHQVKLVKGSNDKVLTGEEKVMENNNKGFVLI